VKKLAKKSFSPMKKNLKHQLKGKPHTHEKFQCAATSTRDAIIIFRGLNLYDGHCTAVRITGEASLTAVIASLMQY
jgi:hypothetical protein